MMARGSRTRKTRATFAAITGALALATSPLHAQDAPKPDAPKADAPPAPPPAPAVDLPAQAAERKKAGDQAMEALRYADAIAAYGDAHAITRDPALLYNLGRALQALNRFPEALDKLEAFAAAAPPELKARVPRLGKLIEELRQRVSTVTVRTSVAGARILVRNTVVGRSPLAAPVKLDSGPAEIETEADGYFPAKKSVDLPGGAALAVELELHSRDTTGQLSVSASAIGAEVTVDGKRIGVAPVELNIARGTHEVQVRHPDFRLYQTSTVVPAGGAREVKATLQSKSVVQQWWFWTGVAVVVAGGVALAVAETRERAPDSGTIPPSQIYIKSPPAGPALFHF